MEADSELLAAFARLTRVAGVEAAYAWGRVSEVLPPHRRVTFFEKVLASEPYASTPVASVEDVEATSALAQDDETFAAWLEQLLFAAAKKGPSTSYLLAGFRLATQFKPNYRFEDVGQCDLFPEAEAEEIAIRLDDSGWLALLLWERCGRLPGLAGLIKQSRWRSFTPIAARRYFHFLAGIVYSDLPERSLQRKWRAIANQLPRIEALLVATPDEYQGKAIEYIADWLAWWDDPDTIRRRVPSGCELVRRVAAPPFLRGDTAGRALFCFLELEAEEDLQRFLTAPDKALQALEAACRRETDAALIGRGLTQLIRGPLGRFTLDALHSHPKRLCRTAKLLGSASAPARMGIVRDRASPGPNREPDPGKAGRVAARRDRSFAGAPGEISTGARPKVHLDASGRD